MGERTVMHEAMSYEFTRFVDFPKLRSHLLPFYSEIDRPSIDRELLLRHPFGAPSLRRGASHRCGHSGDLTHVSAQSAIPAIQEEQEPTGTIMMSTGTVKFFNTTKGFGFIEQGNGQPDIFVHITAVERSGMSLLTEGQKVSFDVVMDRRSGKSAAQNLHAL